MSTLENDFIRTTRLAAAITVCLFVGCHGRTGPIDGGEAISDAARADGGGPTVDGGEPTRDGGAPGPDAGAACEPPCGASGTCIEGACRCGSSEACREGLVCCAGACVDTSIDVEHCGGCGIACPSGARSTRTCSGSGCSYLCDDAFADCDAAIDGCETDLGSVETCGSCTSECESGDVCGESGGSFLCAPACEAGLTECAGSCIDTDRSVSHCGGCGQPCAALPFATVTCSGACDYACQGSRMDCNGNLGAPGSDGCETDAPLAYPDLDGDSFGDGTAAGARVCPGTAGYVSDATDCDDGAAGVHPGSVELCNDRDDDCDGTIDEDLTMGSCACEAGSAMVVGTYRAVAAPNDVTFTWVESRGQGALAWGARDTLEGYAVFFSRIDADGSAPVRDIAVVVGLTVRPRNIQVGWDGSAWAIFYTSGLSGRLRVVRLNEDGTTATLAWNVARPLAGTATITRARLAQGEDQLAIVTDRSGASELLGLVYANGSVRNELVVVPGFAPWGFDPPAITYVGSGSYAAIASDHTFGPIGSTPVRRIVAQRFDELGTEGPSVELYPDEDAEVPLDAAYDPASDRIALVYTDLDPAGSSRTQQLLLRGSDGAPSAPPIEVGPGAWPGFVGPGGDGSFVSAIASPFATLRTRAADGAAFPSTFPAPVGFDVYDLAGLPDARRYLVVSGYSGEIFAQLYACLGP